MVAGLVTKSLSVLVAVLVAALSVLAAQECRFGSIASLQVRNIHNASAPAVMTIGSDDGIVIEFDELSTAARNLRWCVEHCDARWQPDGLMDIEFTDGLNEAIVDEYSYSQGTLSHYVHYVIRIPDERVPLKISGNYLLKVYEENAPETPLLSVRFSVAEGNAAVYAGVSAKTDIDYMKSHQQLEIMVDTKATGVRNPYTDLIVLVEQNPGDRERIELTTPSSVRGSEVRYEHLRPLIFNGGNEYRRFETVSTSYPGKGVDKIEHTADGYFAILYKDEPRSAAGYQYDRTQNGRFTIRECNSDRSDTEAEYVHTLFTFESPKIPGVEVHLDGEFTGGRLDNSSRMEYNPYTGGYEKTMYLKQGAYDYRYVTVKPGGKSVSFALTEGNYCDTGNQYIIYVYYRLPGEQYDRLAAVGGTTVFDSK